MLILMGEYNIYCISTIKVYFPFLNFSKHMYTLYTTTQLFYV